MNVVKPILFSHLTRIVQRKTAFAAEGPLEGGKVFLSVLVADGFNGICLIQQGHVCGTHQFMKWQYATGPSLYANICRAWYTSCNLYLWHC